MPATMVRLTGIPALARRLSQQVNSKSPRVVREAVDQAGKVLAAIDALFSSGKVDPSTLTPASSKAYQELKRIQVEPHSPTPGRRLQKPRLNGRGMLHLNRHISCIHTHLQEAADGQRDPVLVQAEISQLAGYLAGLLQQAGISPWELNGPSACSCAWLEFLGLASNLNRHLGALQRFNKVAQELGSQKRSFTAVIFTCQKATYRYQRRTKGTSLQANEGFIDAPGEVLKALALVASGSRSQKARQSITTYTLSPEYLAVTRELAGSSPEAGHKVQDRRLVDIFDRLNRQYFHGELARPHLTWSPRASQRVLGTYVPASDSIVISRSLQGTDIPLNLLEFVVYHEMLHKVLGTRLAGGTRRVHTAEFRRREALFEGIQQALAEMSSPRMKGKLLP